MASRTVLLSIGVDISKNKFRKWGKIQKIGKRGDGVNDNNDGSADHYSVDDVRNW